MSKLSNKGDKVTTGGAVEGGRSNHMSGRTYAGPQQPGTTTQNGQGTSGKTIAGGHGNHMVGQQHAGPQVPGQTATKTSGPGPSGFGVKGGTTKMFGPQKANAAKPC